MYARTEGLFKKKELSVTPIANNEWIIDCQNEDNVILECDKDGFKAYQILNMDNPKVNLDIRVLRGSLKNNLIIPFNNKVKIKVNTTGIDKIGIIGHEGFNKKHNTVGNMDTFEYQDESKVLIRGWIGDSFYPIKDIYFRFTNEKGECILEESVTRRYRMDLVEALKDTKYLYSGFTNYVEYKSGTDVRVDVVCYTPDRMNCVELGVLHKNVEDSRICDIRIIDSKKHSVENKYLELWNTPSVLECYNFINELEDNLILFINHSFGGGADLYLRKEADKLIQQGKGIYQVIYQPDYHQYELMDMNSGAQYYFDDINILLYLVSIKAQCIYLNELVSYPNIKGLIDTFKNVKDIHSNVQLTYLVHDYFCICPRLNMIDCNDNYCGLPNVSECDACLQKANFDQSKSIVDWRSLNSKLLSTCDEIICFSNSSKNYLSKVYSNLSGKIEVIGHEIENLRVPVVKKDDVITVGLLGQLCKHKGIEQIKELIQYIRKNKLTQYRIVCIGHAQDIENDEIFYSTGKYKRDDISNLVEKYDVDVFFMSSVCPETFSYTVSEIQSMNMPLLSYDLGAQGERTRDYKFGKVIPLNCSPEVILKAIKDLCEGDVSNE